MLLFPEFLIGCGDIAVTFCRLCLNEECNGSAAGGMRLLCKKCGRLFHYWFALAGLRKKVERESGVRVWRGAKAWWWHGELQYSGPDGSRDAFISAFLAGPNATDVAVWLTLQLTRAARFRRGPVSRGHMPDDLRFG